MFGVFRVKGLGLRAQGEAGSSVCNLGFRVSSLGSRVEGQGLRV